MELELSFFRLSFMADGPDRGILRKRLVGFLEKGKNKSKCDSAFHCQLIIWSPDIHSGVLYGRTIVALPPSLHGKEVPDRPA